MNPAPSLVVTALSATGSMTGYSEGILVQQTTAAYMAERFRWNPSMLAVMKLLPSIVRRAWKRVAAVCSRSINRRSP